MEPEHYLSDIKAMWWPYTAYALVISVVEYLTLGSLGFLISTTTVWLLIFGDDTINYYKLYRKAKKQQLQAVKDRL